MLSVSGCRGLVGASLTPEVMTGFAGAAAGWIADRAGVASPRVVLACDGRRGGAVLKGLVGSALVTSGCEVIDIGVATTPTVGVMVGHHSAHGGLTLTASHNPEPWNGIKVVTSEGSAPDAEAANAIIARYHARQALRATPDRFGSLRVDDGAAEVHVARVLEALARVADLGAIRGRRFGVVLDSVNCSGARAGRMLLEALGCRVTHLHGESTGVFPHPPEPTAENLAGLGRQILEARADVGFAQDPDADRLAIIDEAGRYIGEEYTLVFAAQALLGGAGGGAAGRAIVANLSTSRMIDDVAAASGAVVHRSAVGEANVVTVMRRVSALLGGEGNGGVIWPEVTFIRDSLGAMGLTLALMQRTSTGIAGLVSRVPAYAILKRKADLKPGLTQRALDAASRAFPGAAIDRQDGVRADFEAPSGSGRAWLHARASNTEPIIRLIAEAPSAEESGRILDRVTQLIEAS